MKIPNPNALFFCSVTLDYSISAVWFIAPQQSNMLVFLRSNLKCSFQVLSSYCFVHNFVGLLWFLILMFYLPDACFYYLILILR